MWQIYAVVMHLLLLGAIVMIYFQTLLLHNLQPQPTMRQLGLQPPADRLVVFLTDGLRAASFYAKNCSRIPQLRQLLLREGLVGISHTCAPTQTRPGNIAIFGGFLEDPSAALYNYKRNPTQFDTVFNRSRHAYGWSNDYIYDTFTRLDTGGQPLKFRKYINDDFTGKPELDKWVFEQVQQFLDGNASDTLRNATPPVVFLIYSSDLDEAGHVYKPDSETFLRKLNYTQHGIRQVYEQFEHKFQDQRTVYLLTSDHGMTDWGAHAADSPHEVEVPFFLWGAGVNRVAPHAAASVVVSAQGVTLPLHSLQQTQLAPLMSALIGLPPPMNSQALLPLGYMNVSAQYEAQAAHLNALQLLAQAEQLLQRHRTGYFSKWLPQYQRLCSRHIAQYKLWCQQQLACGCYDSVLERSQQQAQLAIECIQYYSHYYRPALLVSTIVSYAGWFYFMLAVQARGGADEARGWHSLRIYLLGVAALLFGVCLLLQQTPCWTCAYLLLPLCVWALALRERGRVSPCCLLPHMQLLVVAATAALVIVSFAEKRLMALAYVLCVCVHNRRALATPTPKLCVWLSLVLLLGCFQLLPQRLGRNDMQCLYASMLLVLARPLLYVHQMRWHSWLINALVLLFAGYGVYLREHDQHVGLALHALMWLYLGYSFISIPLSRSSSLEQRCELLLFNLCTLYTLLCLSKECIFMQLLCYECVLRLQLQAATQVEPAQKADNPRTPAQQLYSAYQLAVLLLIYTYFSFFGTGNEPSVNSFDVNVTRLFMTNYQLGIMAALVQLKLFLPALIVLASLYAYSEYARQHSNQMFCCVFLVSDALSLYYCCCVRNKGIWWDVRYSISHLMIVHCTPVMLLGLSYVAKLLLSGVNTSAASSLVQLEKASSV